MNPYRQLDVPINATSEEIKLRFKTLAQFHHPDKGGDAEIFKLIRSSYEILIDPIRRRKFDLTGDYSPDENFHTEALGRLSEFVVELIYTINPDRDNFLDILRTKIEQFKAEFYKNQILANDQILHLEKIQSKIKINPEARVANKENLLYAFIENQLEMKRNEYRLMTRRIKVLEHMMIILEDYDYLSQILLEA